MTGWFDPAEVRRDDELVENLRQGGPIPAGRIARMLAAWRDDMHRAIDAYFDGILARLAAEQAPPAPPPAVPSPADPSPAPQVEQLPYLDAQSRAFRENPVPVTDEQLALLAEQVHPAATSLSGILLREDHEALHWDMGRATPKTVDEAKAALAARIADPTAPDDSTVAGAYDDLEDGSHG
jgi:hypothetical protein